MLSSTCLLGAGRASPCPPASPRDACSIPDSLYNHPAWIEWKAGFGWKRAGSLGGGVLLTRPIGPSASMAYAACPAGSLGEGSAERGAVLESLSREALDMVGSDCAFIRWDLMAPAWADEAGIALPPRLQELRMNASTRERRLRKSPIEYTCPDTMVVDLRGGAEASHGRMDYRTRYSVRLAGRRGTVVERGGGESLGLFQELHEETARRHGLRRFPEETYRSLFRAARERGLGLDLYVAALDGEGAASAIIARHGREAWYLFAASSREHRRAAGPSAILYRAIMDLCGSGCESLDLLGVGPASAVSASPACAGSSPPAGPLAGLSLFKSGFGGRRLSRAGAWDYVIDEGAYAGYSAFELASP